MTTDRPKRRRMMISLRVMMLLVLIIGACMGWLVNKARQQREAVAAVKKFGGWVHYDHEFVPRKVKVPQGNDLWAPPWGKLTVGRDPRGPTWLRRTLGDEYFREIAHVSLFVDIEKGEAHAGPWNVGPADKVLAKLVSQTGIKTLQIGGQQATDRGMEYIGEMTGLKELIIFPARGISNAGVAHMKGLRNLINVFINDSKMTDEGLRYLGELPNVEQLKLPGHRFSDKGLAYLKRATHLKTLSVGSGENDITDAGIESLKGMNDLEMLDISGSKVTDRGLEQLKGLPKLRELWVSKTPTTEAGVKRLREMMPNVKVTGP